MNGTPLKIWFDRGGRLLRLRLSRPKANVLDAAMIGALAAALRENRERTEIAAVLLDAEGPHFSFGASVEDLASANEEVLARIGMGGRALKQRAIDWLTSAGSTGKASEELSALKASNENLQARNEQLETQLRELAAKVEALSGDKPAAKSQKL